tara:strand:+ start:35 stop:289 length:255 start_codon:yes stop_codon:yes gene_type:complete
VVNNYYHFSFNSYRRLYWSGVSPKVNEKRPNKKRLREAPIMNEKMPNNFIVREIKSIEKIFIPHTLESFIESMNNGVHYIDYQI